MSTNPPQDPQGAGAPGQSSPRPPADGAPPPSGAGGGYGGQPPGGGYGAPPPPGAGGGYGAPPADGGGYGGQPPGGGYGGQPAGGGYGGQPPGGGYGGPPPGGPGYGYGGPPPPATAYGGPQQPLSESDQRMWATLAHILPIIGLSFIPPLVIWLVFKERGRFVEEQAKEALNFQIAVIIAGVAIGIIGVLTLGAGTLLYFPLLLIAAILMILAAVAVNRGEAYRYPLNIRIIS